MSTGVPCAGHDPKPGRGQLHVRAPDGRSAAAARHRKAAHPPRPGPGRQGLLQQNRAVATRYDERDVIFDGTVQVASIRI
jgi:hypothetical protein